MSKNGKPIYKRVRMYHEILEDIWCHAWDVDLEAFNIWTTGGTPLASSSVYLPTGNHPLLGSSVLCGTCGIALKNPRMMKTEVINV